ncbi:MAG: bicyclomycin/multidrug efflux system [Candidatus Methanofastidiosum methylothiophilum]|uniref:Bicyclomycin/multidrug efflux system n=1 Tax=Candidatus Methanofastidiosum methylothiophilum TaxID=1705564 RepID=A0A150J482_9EURY|nr:MAG: bicyclomycin/multidrug efflux system [Candidatus Methanofastidiosum methylthiophilus]
MDKRTKILIYSFIGFSINLSYIAGNLFISNFAESLGASKSFIGIINAILPLFSILSAFLFAKKAAKARKKLPIIRFGFVLGLIFSVFLFFSNDKFWILFLRMGMGVSFGAIIALTDSLATEIDIGKRGKYFGIYSGASCFGWGIGSLLVGLVVTEKYNNAFLIQILFLTIGLIATFFVTEKHTSVDYFGLDFEEFKKFFPFYRTLVLRHSVATAIWAFLPLYLEYTLGFDRFFVSLVFLINNSVQLVTMPLTGHLSDRIKRKYLVLTGLIGSLIFIYLFTQVTDFVEILFLQILVGFSWSSLYIGISSLVADASTWNERGEAMAGLNISINFSSIMGPLIGGIIYQFSDFSMMIYVLMPMSILAIVSATRLKETKKSHNIYK